MGIDKIIEESINLREAFRSLSFAEIIDAYRRKKNTPIPKLSKKKSIKFKVLEIRINIIFLYQINKAVNVINHIGSAI